MAKFEPVLNPADRQSPLWLKLKKHAEERLAKMRVRNDSMKLDEKDTASMRGRIAELKYLATLDNPAPQTEADETFKD